MVKSVKEAAPDASAATARTNEWGERSTQRREAARLRAEDASDQRPINKAWFTKCLSDVLDDDTIVLNELGIDAVQIGITRPASFFSVPASGGLGWAVGASLGAKLAAPR